MFIFFLNKDSEFISLLSLFITDNNVGILSAGMNVHYDKRASLIALWEVIMLHSIACGLWQNTQKTSEIAATGLQLDTVILQSLYCNRKIITDEFQI